MGSLLRFIIVLALFSPALLAHDAWVQTNAHLVRLGDVVYIDLMMGNHGNDHRDFKLAGKADLATGTFHLIDPEGKRYDLRPEMVDLGYTPKEGHWAGRFTAGSSGPHMVAYTSDKVVSYAPLRSIKSAKAFFVATKDMNQPEVQNPGFDRVLGHPLELVPTENPVTRMAPGRAITVKVLFQGRPLAGARVSFIPRGTQLADGFDERFERRTDEAGLASFTPTEANYYLVAVHHRDDTSGEGYEGTKYAATMTVIVPAICSCCGE